jgi:hypothetical protein
LRRPEPAGEAAFLARAGLDGPSLVEWMTMTQEELSALQGLADQARQAAAMEARAGGAEVEEDAWVREEIAAALGER